MIRQNLQWIFGCAVLCVLCYRVAVRNPYGHYFGEIIDKIETNYFEPRKPEELFNRAVENVMDELDQNSSYIVPERSHKFINMLDNKLDGIGVQTFSDKKERHLFVQLVFDDTPAEAAGIKPGDQIISVDGTAVEKVGSNEARKLIGGQPGTKVNLQIQRYDSPKLIDMPNIPRQEITLPSIRGYARDRQGKWSYAVTEAEEISYIALNQFSKDSDEELRDAMNSFATQAPRAFILDLRDNEGGYVPAAVNVCDLFLESGDIVTVEGRNRNAHAEYRAKADGTLPDFPMVVLINQNSASSSEIAAAALQDNRRATIIGERSFGKGTVQHVYELTPHANGQRPILKLTVAKFLRPRPDHKNIHRNDKKLRKDSLDDEWGVTPDEGFAVPLTAAQEKRLESWQFHRELGAIPPQEEILSLWKMPVESEDKVKSNGKLMDDDSPDPQLKKAIEHLQKQLQKNRRQAT